MVSPSAVRFKKKTMIRGLRLLRIGADRLFDGLGLIRGLDEPRTWKD
jgi:hypothetical protein